ncbi:fumarate/nitrate reduction transcriptional regulator Fnr [sulfur-oxidizing endosymbiont of Gigantopelta aegis]|uniref:fumarate/nitrate reduction transcriptional regulator Fnr n=1 Tax=sulfur-oxidizing endosymbiont of Gigantopelta aegis TaxID=2794934 RepID=UPI0018DBA62E|nr:fumarate/nitrate reduction transcriptional regulator Fnr [sulfur-oxidizing endosymbiont of Gigantopelta aegis]
MQQKTRQSQQTQQRPKKVLDFSTIKVACKECSLHQLCLPRSINGADLEKLDSIIERKKPLKRNEHLFQVGGKFNAIYVVRSGSLKTYSPTVDGQEQVTGFHLPGELLGLDAIGKGKHPCAAKALETTSICEVPFEDLEKLTQELPTLQRQLLRLMSKEIFDDQELMLLLGKKTAEARLSAFLLSISLRFKQRGFSSIEFYLSMSRNDIANYLGLAVETVSRMFTRFQEEGLIAAERKHIVIKNREALQLIAGVNDMSEECSNKKSQATI